jgi:hypothetical protein
MLEVPSGRALYSQTVQGKSSEDFRPSAEARSSQALTVEFIMMWDAVSVTYRTEENRMTRSTHRSTIAALLVALALVFLPYLAAAQVKTSMNVSGHWNLTVTGATLMSGVLNLKQVQNTVVGSFGKGGQFNGTFKDPHTISANFKSPKGETGWITMVISADQKSMQGQWGYAGRKAEGQFVGHRAK